MSILIVFPAIIIGLFGVGRRRMDWIGRDWVQAYKPGHGTGTWGFIGVLSA